MSISDEDAIHVQAMKELFQKSGIDSISIRFVPHATYTDIEYARSEDNIGVVRVHDVELGVARFVRIVCARFSSLINHLESLEKDAAQLRKLITADPEWVEAVLNSKEEPTETEKQKEIE